MAHDVFISYCAEDKPTADAVCATLEAQSIRCWIAPRDILPGVDWGEAIIDAINDSHALVLVFTSKANNSPQIKREVERAVNRAIPIIPVRVEDALPSKSLEYFISTPHWLDALTPPLEQHLLRLAETLKLLMVRLNHAGVGASVETAGKDAKRESAVPPVQFCIHCGARRQPGNRFCTSCGKSLPD